MEKDMSIVDGIIERDIPETHRNIYQKMKDTEDARKVNPHIKSKTEALYLTIKAKDMLERRLRGEIEDREFAYELATDEKLRITTNNLVQQVLHPTPIEVIHGRPDQFVDIAAGVSTFWKEMHNEIPIKIENAAAVENVIMNINAGLDIDMEPDVRKTFLKEAGIEADKLAEFVPLQDYIIYENNLKDMVRLQIMNEMGVSSEELSENDELLIDSMTEDRMFSQKIVMDEEASTVHEPTYEEIYGISAQDMYEMFAEDKSGVTVPTHGDNVSVDDAEWSHVMEMAGAEDAYNDMLNASIEENMAAFYDAYLEEQSAGLNFDLDFVNDLSDEIVKQ